MTCPDCAYHKTRIAHLERELGLRKADEDFALIRTALDVELTMVRVVLRLHAARGKWVTKDALMTVITTDDERNFHTRMSRLRKTIGRDMIDVGEKGMRAYRMSEIGVAAIDAILSRRSPSERPCRHPESEPRAA